MKTAVVAISILVTICGCSSAPKEVKLKVSDLKEAKFPETSEAKSAEVPKSEVAPETVEIAVLDQVSDDVHVKSAVTGQILPAQTGQKITVKDQILTGKKSKAKVVLVDKTEVTLLPETQIEVHDYEKEKRAALIQLLSGKMRAKIVQKYAPGSEGFRVQTPTAVAGVRGTDFVMAFDPEQNKSDLFTIMGLVEFGNLNADGSMAKSIPVAAGQMSSVSKGEIPSAPVKISPRILNELTRESEEPSEKASEKVAGNRALQWLKHGNIRFLKRWVRADGQSNADVQRLANGENPHAIILSCSDSRVPPELIFDQKLGEIYVIRTAGPALDESVIASVEYAVSKLRVGLLVALGHTACETVKTAHETAGGSNAASNAFQHVLSDIHSRIKNDSIESAPLANARGVIEDLKARSSIIREAISKGALVVQSALYSTDTGVVKFE